MSLYSTVLSFKSGAAIVSPIAAISVLINNSITDNTIIPAQFTASISTTVMAVSAISTGVISADRVIVSTSITPGTTILSQITPLTGGEVIGGIGRYTVSNSQTVSSEAMTASYPTIDSFISAMTADLAATTTKMNTFNSNLNNLLPLMASADKIEKTMKYAQGIIPKSGPSSSYDTVFFPLTVVTTNLTNINSAITTNHAGLIIGNAGAITAIDNARTTALTNINNCFTASDVAKADLLSLVKAHSQAGFSSQPKSPQAKSVMDLVIPAIPNKAAFDLDNAYAIEAIRKSSDNPSAYNLIDENSLDSNTKQIAIVADVPITRHNTLCGIGLAAFKANYLVEILSVDTQIKTVQDDIVDSMSALDVWKNSNMPTYNTIKRASLNDIADQAKADAYAAMQSSLQSTYPGWVNHINLINTYNDLIKRAAHLQKQWVQWNLEADARYVDGHLTDSGDGVFICDSALW